MLQLPLQAVMGDLQKLQAELQEQSREDTFGMALVGLLIAGLGLVVVWFVGYGIARPLKQMVAMLDDIAQASSAISEALDVSPAVGKAPYTLEVSTRGVSKPLTEPKHFRRNAGRLVKLWLGDDQITGRIRSVTDEAVTIEVDGAEREVPLAEIDKAVVQVEMNRSFEDEEEN